MHDALYIQFYFIFFFIFFIIVASHIYFIIRQSGARRALCVDAFFIFWFFFVPGFLSLANIIILCVPMCVAVCIYAVVGQVARCCLTVCTIDDDVVPTYRAHVICAPESTTIILKDKSNSCKLN